METTTLVSVKKEGAFTRSGPEVADEVMGILVYAFRLGLLAYVFIVDYVRLRYSEERRI